MDGVLSGRGERASRLLRKERQRASRSLTDEYHVFLHPVVLGHGEPFLAGEAPKLRLVGCERIGEQAVKLTYAPA